jgi:hypothetical protein
MPVKLFAGQALAGDVGSATPVAPVPREEHPVATIQEAALAASCLAALTGVGYLEDAQTLKAMAERASRRRRESGVAGARAGSCCVSATAFGSPPGP